MKIGCDLDGTVFMTYEKMQERYKRIKGKEFNLELVLDFNLARNPLDRMWLFTYFRSPENYRNIESYPNAVYTICKLKESHEFYFLTIRPPLTKIKEATRETLKEYFDIPTQNILFCKNFEDKVQIAKRLGIKILIEDNIGTIVSASAIEDIHIFLLRRPWNKTINNSRVELVDSWKEILDKF